MFEDTRILEQVESLVEAASFSNDYNVRTQLSNSIIQIVNKTGEPVVNYISRSDYEQLRFSLNENVYTYTHDYITDNKIYKKYNEQTKEEDVIFEEEFSLHFFEQEDLIENDFLNACGL